MTANATLKWYDQHTYENKKRPEPAQREVVGEWTYHEILNEDLGQRHGHMTENEHRVYSNNTYNQTKPKERDSNNSKIKKDQLLAHTNENNKIQLE